MTYFNKQWTEAITLPDGTVAECVQDVDRYLRTNGLAASSDYSDAFRKNVKFNREKATSKLLFAEFINNYKRRIWNAIENQRNTGTRVR